MRICSICKIKKPLTEFNIKYGNKQHYRCKDCNKIYLKKYYQDNKSLYAIKRKTQQDKLNLWYQTLKSKLKCNNCEESHIACLDFHHINDINKELAIATMVAITKSKETILKEIQKCIVLCSNCHRKLHYNKKNNIINN